MFFHRLLALESFYIRDASLTEGTLLHALYEAYRSLLQYFL